MNSYKSKKGAAALEQKINEYFLECDRMNGDDKKAQKPYTLSGLLFHLGMSQEELLSLCESRLHRRIINNAKLRIEAFIEENALNGRLASTAAINSLKYNFGWSDKKPDEQSYGGLSIVLEGDAEKLSE